MKRFLVLMSLLIAIAMPAVAQVTSVSSEAMIAAEWPMQYPEILNGVLLGEGGDGFLTLSLSCWAPWGTAWDDGECAYYPGGVGYVIYGEPLMLINGESEEVAYYLHVTSQLAINLRRIIGAELPGYGGEGKSVPWSDACGCYLITEPTNNGITRFEAWTIQADGDAFYRTGCFESTGSIGPWQDFSKQCVFLEFSVGEVPDWPTTREGGKRIRR